MCIAERPGSGEVECAPTPAARVWAPILPGELRQEAAAAAYSIADNILQRASARRAEGSPRYGSLESGTAGHALLFAYLHLHSSEERYRVAAETHLSHATEWIAAVPLRPQLYEGFVGVAWTVEHIAKRLQMFNEPDPADDIDDAITRYLEQPSRRPMQFDLLRGLAGVAVYALERLPRPRAISCLERIIEHLDALAERDQHGLAWRTYPEMLEMDEDKYPSGNFNLGVAHGSPGVISVLGQVCASRVARSRVGVLLEDAVRWLLVRKQASAAPSHFPSFYYPGIPNDHARLAWCHGDPGIAAAMLVAAACVGRADLAQEALEIARSGAQVLDSGFPPRDATLCHGAVGLGHIYNRMYHLSGEEWLRDAAIAWFRHAFTFRNARHLGVAGFRSWNLVRDTPTMWGWKDQLDFLRGATGTALGLLAASSSVEPSWDRVLGISPAVASGMLRSAHGAR